MTWFATNVIASFLLPPLSLLILFIAGLVLLFIRPASGRIVLTAASILLWIVSTPYFAEGGMRWLEKGVIPLPDKHPSADAIVILGGGTYFHAPEYAGRDTVSADTLLRLRYGARLQRETGKPVLVTGGKPLGNSLSEAEQMQEILEQDFHVAVRWTENESSNTFENANNSFRILQREGIHRIYLVTHAWHMPRAAQAFRRAGFEVVEAPTAFSTRYRTDLLAFLPRAESLQDSNIFIHELIGLLWYRVKWMTYENRTVKGAS